MILSIVQICMQTCDRNADPNTPKDGKMAHAKNWSQAMTIIDNLTLQKNMLGKVCQRLGREVNYKTRKKKLANEEGVRRGIERHTPQK